MMREDSYRSAVSDVSHRRPLRQVWQVTDVKVDAPQQQYFHIGKSRTFRKDAADQRFTHDQFTHS